jgi:hypothetical protein
MPCSSGVAVTPEIVADDVSNEPAEVNVSPLEAQRAEQDDDDPANDVTMATSPPPSPRRKSPASVRDRPLPATRPATEGACGYLPE